MSQGEVRLHGKRYLLETMDEDDVAPGTLVRFATGSAVRRVVCLDAGEVILRGVRSTDVFEAVTEDSLLREWYRLVPAT